MKTLIKTMALLSVLAVASCQQFKIDTQMTPEKAAASIRMECSAVDVYNLPAQNPGSITFNVSSNTPWTIILSSGAEWLNVSPASSASSSLITDVVVTAQNNTGGDRSATLTLKGENVAQTKVITINQAREGKLFITPMVQDYAACGGPLSFTIQTNVAWEVRSSAGWLTFNRTSGEPDPDGRIITIIATAEASTVLERVATVTVVAGEEEESFDVSQKGMFELTEIGDAFATAGEEKTISLRTDLPWTIMSDKDWLTFDQESGNGDGSKVAIKATASANAGALRKANVKVTAGGVDKTFEVSQNGLTFELIAPASTELPRLGGEMVIGVNSSMAWEPATEVAGWEVEKIDATSFKVKAAFNNIFKPKTGKVSISAAGGAYEELELSQGINFTFTDAEVQEDGSVKIFGDKKSRITTIDGFRYVSFVLAIGDKNFDDKAQFFACTHDAAGDSELQCQINLAGNKRLRTNGAHTTYGSSSFSITKDDLNALTEYRMDFRPNAENPANIDLEFFYNGTSKKVYTSTSPYASDATFSGHYFFGTESAAEGSTTWYIIKSCTPTFIAE